MLSELLERVVKLEKQVGQLVGAQNNATIKESKPAKAKESKVKESKAKPAKAKEAKATPSTPSE